MKEVSVVSGVVTVLHSSGCYPDGTTTAEGMEVYDTISSSSSQVSVH